MSIAKKSETGKDNSYAADSLLDMAGKMGQWICEAAAEGRAFHEFESEWHEMIHRMANLGTGVFISLQGDGDLGETVTTDEGVKLQRSAEPVNRPLQTVFGLFQIQAYVYARGPKRKIELRPVDARMQLPPGYASYLFEEFSQCFCVEQRADLRSGRTSGKSSHGYARLCLFGGSLCAEACRHHRGPVSRS